ncbi:hypothetical protein [Rhodopirellula europaea]|uniref:Secreted protein n=1 Tax=Rhodopirellula europaea 6C TaxID=1263867 RepID=M2AD18_9BACT|nr:hypothetical protein [Rhodopirellula europaea]EMB14910.1 secreted protein [Rhodopirellula europaea 6C]
MKNLHWLSALLLTCLVSTPVFAERAWQGSIHLMDANILFHFDGYGYGDWHTIGGLRFPGNRLRAPRRNLVDFRLLPSKEDPLRTSIKARVEIKIDGYEAAFDRLDFTRSSRHADWRIDPRFIQRLKTEEAAKQSTQSDPKAAIPVSRQHGGSLEKDD